MQNREIKDVNETNIYTRACLLGSAGEMAHVPRPLIALSLSLSICVGVSEAEWTEWFDRDDERGSGDWEKLSELHKAFPERLCSNPLDIEVNILRHAKRGQTWINK